MSSEEINLILGTLNDIQDRIKEQYESKMSTFTPLQDFTNEKDESAAMKNRLDVTEKNTKENAMRGSDNAAGIVYVKKQLKAMDGKMNSLSRRTASALSEQKQSASDAAAANDAANLDAMMEGGDIDAEGMGNVVRMI